MIHLLFSSIHSIATYHFILIAFIFPITFDTLFAQKTGGHYAKPTI
jgi:hypothetical protein